MGANNRLDESFRSNTLQKSLTGQSSAQINTASIKISSSGNIVASNTQASSQNANANTTKTTSGR